jgi:hypothetical protein
MSDKNMRVIESAVTQNYGTKEDILLYEELLLSLELMEDKRFNLIESSIDKGINFGISTPYPHGLPVEIGTLFFNADMNYDVKIKETSKCVYNVERYFEIKIKKD